MSRKLELTFACGDYEIMRALKEGIVRPEGIELTVLTDMGPSPRHWRFLRGREFDVAEVSGSGYVAARDQDLPFRARAPGAEQLLGTIERGSARR